MSAARPLYQLPKGMTVTFLYRNILRHAHRFPSIKRAELIQNIKLGATRTAAALLHPVLPRLTGGSDVACFPIQSFARTGTSLILQS